MFLAEIDIPDELHDYCQLHPNCHRELGKALDAINMSYSKGKLTVITTEDVTRKLCVLRDIHVRKLYERMYLSFQMSENVTLKSGEKMPEAICEKIVIKKELFKFVVGHKKVNLRRAKAIKGILGMGF